ncbi:MAG: hypothetical protein U0790_25400 [Isosphaeraceae bacterium]
MENSEGGRSSRLREGLTMRLLRMRTRTLMVLIAMAAISIYYAAILFGLHWEVPSQLAVAKQVDEWVRRTSAKDRRDGSITGNSGRGIHWERNGSSSLRRKFILSF